MDGEIVALAKRRLSGAERKQQLLAIALKIVQEEGADRLTLGHLASCAGVSKPVAYDHFPTRSALLIELYRAIDTERVEAFRALMAGGTRSVGETARVLAGAYIRCASDTTDAFHAVGAALAGSEEKSVVFQELLDNCVSMFASVLSIYSDLPPPELNRRCVGLVGAGEALSAGLLRGLYSESEAIETLARMVMGGMRLTM